eukprot:366360-Chlamydomonas_euryale.AAC.16
MDLCLPLPTMWHSPRIQPAVRFRFEGSFVTKTVDRSDHFSISMLCQNRCKNDRPQQQINRPQQETTTTGQQTTTIDHKRQADHKPMHKQGVHTEARGPGARISAEQRSHSIALFRDIPVAIVLPYSRTYLWPF